MNRRQDALLGSATEHARALEAASGSPLQPAHAISETRGLDAGKKALCSQTT